MKIERFSTGGTAYPNEDSMVVIQLSPGKVLAILADGMGGLSFGRMAADLSVNAIASFVCDHMGKLPVRELLVKSLKYADTVIAGKSMELRSKMGAAVAIAYITGNAIHCTWLGNVRIYLNANKSITQLTTDHVLDVGYGRQMLTRCLKGDGIRPDVPYLCRKVESGSILCLCSDGFYKQTESNKMMHHSIRFNEEYEDDASLIRIDL